MRLTPSPGKRYVLCVWGCKANQPILCRSQEAPVGSWVLTCPLSVMQICMLTVLLTCEWSERRCVSYFRDQQRSVRGRCSEKDHYLPFSACFCGINLLSNSVRFHIFSPPLFFLLSKDCHGMSLPCSSPEGSVFAKTSQVLVFLEDTHQTLGLGGWAEKSRRLHSWWSKPATQVLC